MKKIIILAFMLSAILGALAFLGSNWVKEAYHEWYMLTFVGFLLGFTLAAGVFRTGRKFQMGLAVGTVWGFMFTIGIAVSIMNQRISIDLITFPIGLVVAPLGFFAISQIGSAIGRILEPGEVVNSE